MGCDFQHTKEMDKEIPTGEEEVPGAGKPWYKEVSSGRDAKEMFSMGKRPRLKRMFGFLSLLGFTTSLMATWAGVFVSNFTALLDGGPVTLIYGTIYSWTGSLATAASLGELASMFPLAAGQYHFTAELAPKRGSIFLSWITGWIAVLGWITNVSAAIFFAGSLTQGVILLDNSFIEYERWQATLLLLGFILILTLFNIFGVRYFPKLETMILVLYIPAFIGVLVPLVVTAPHHNASFVFTGWSNTSGWSSDGLVWFIGLISTSLPFLGYDGAIKMSEDTTNASTVVPWCMIFTILINGTLGLGTTIAFLFCMGDLQAVIKAGSKTGFDFIHVFFNATESYAGTSAMTAVLITIVTFAGFCALATASRQTWAFARDQGLPFSNYLSFVSEIWGIPLPLRATAFTAIVAALVGLISAGSTAAFNAIVSLTTAGLYISYLIPIVLLLMRRISGDDIKWGPWSMGKFGIFANLWSAMFLFLVTFFSFFPPAIPVTAASMNWSSVVFVGSLLIGLIYYGIWGRHIYSGPIFEEFPN